MKSCCCSETVAAAIVKLLLLLLPYSTCRRTQQLLLLLLISMALNSVVAAVAGEGARPGEEGSGEGPEDLGSLLLDLDLGPGTAAAACSFWETRTLLGAPGSLLLETPLDRCGWRRGPGPGSAEEK